MNELTKATLAIIIILLFFFIGKKYAQKQYELREKTSTEICNMYGVDLREDQFIGGFYKTDLHYYCVRTDLDWYYDQKQKVHESCHALIGLNYTHFCEGHT